MKLCLHTIPDFLSPSTPPIHKDVFLEALCSLRHVREYHSPILPAAAPLYPQLHADALPALQFHVQNPHLGDKDCVEDWRSKSPYSRLQPSHL